MALLHFGGRLVHRCRRWWPKKGKKKKLGLWLHDLSVSHLGNYYMFLEMWKKISFTKKILSKTRDSDALKKES